MNKIIKLSGKMRVIETDPVKVAANEGEKVGRETVEAGFCKTTADLTAFKFSRNPYESGELRLAWFEGFSAGYESGLCSGDDSE